MSYSAYGSTASETSDQLAEQLAELNDQLEALAESGELSEKELGEAQAGLSACVSGQVSLSELQTAATELERIEAGVATVGELQATEQFLGGLIGPVISAIGGLMGEQSEERSVTSGAKNFIQMCIAAQRPSGSPYPQRRRSRIYKFTGLPREYGVFRIERGQP